MSSAPRYETHYTLKDYRQWKGDWELWFGTAVAMGPSPFAPHERCVTRIARALGNQIEAQHCRCEVYTNLDWIVREDTVVRPDVMVVCGQQPTEHLQRPPSIVVEVLSPATWTKDREHKLTLYEQQRVPHYLIADVSNESLEHFRLVDQRYMQGVRSDELRLDIDHNCVITISTQAIFPPAVL